MLGVPAGITVLVALCVAPIVKNTPEETGYPSPNPQHSHGYVRTTVRSVLYTIASNPVVWVVACAYACTGAVGRGSICGSLVS